MNYTLTAKLHDWHCVIAALRAIASHAPSTQERDQLRALATDLHTKLQAAIAEAKGV